MLLNDSIKLFVHEASPLIYEIMGNKYESMKNRKGEKDTEVILHQTQLTLFKLFNCPS
jgi:hypothetical protein